jgi:glyoxylase I family protein
MTDPVAPTGLDHVAINVGDVPAGITFYTETIGLAQNHTRPDFGFPGAWLDAANGQQVHLIEAVVPGPVGQHFALAFEDLGGAIIELRKRGLKVSDAMDVGTTGRQQAFTSDPWGNTIELHQRA